MPFVCRLLRNETELASFGELHEVSTVLFFARKIGDRKSRGLYGVFARLAAEYASGNFSLKNTKKMGLYVIWIFFCLWKVIRAIPARLMHRIHSKVLI